MLSEGCFFEAKKYLQTFKDALRCLEQVAQKQSACDNYLDFYTQFKIAHAKQQLLVDDNGNVSAGDAIRNSYFFSLHRFTR